MLYYEDVEVGSARTSGEFELTEEDVVDFASIWDPSRSTSIPRRPADRRFEASRPPPATSSVSLRGY